MNEMSGTATTGTLPCSGCGQYFGHTPGCYYYVYPTPPQPPYNGTVFPPLSLSTEDSLQRLAAALERLVTALEALVHHQIQKQ